jgi:hypothetical protein
MPIKLIVTLLAAISPIMMARPAISQVAVEEVLIDFVDSKNAPEAVTEDEPQIEHPTCELDGDIVVTPDEISLSAVVCNLGEGIGANIRIRLPSIRF